MALRNKLWYLTIVLVIVFQLANANDDKQACRKRIYCYNCDSRTDDKCGDQFNQTGVPVESCDELCVKVKYKHGDSFYYIRSCADALKKIAIKKTEVCYSTRAKSDGYLCFCKQDLCNNANRFESNRKIIFIYLLVFIMFLIL